MSETHSLRLEINASGARKGAADFESAIRRIDTAVKNLEKNTNNSFSRIQQNAKKLNFKQLADSISRLNSLRLNPSVATNLRSIGTAINAIRPINAATVRSITALGSGIAALRTSQAQIRNITNLISTLNNIRTPANAVRGIQLIAAALNNLRAPANTTSIVAALTSITNSANSTYAALLRLSRLNVNVRMPRQVGGGGAVNPATGRAYGGVRPGYGFGPGRSAASGMRGFENMASVSYQAGTAVRGTMGALTAGALLQQITSVTREMDLFRVSMTSVGVTAEQTENMISSLSRMSTTLGMDFRATSGSMRQLVTAMVASGVSVQDAQGMFENLAVSMRAAGLGVVQQEGSLRAIGQMFGKGRIMAEEFRQQLAEHWTSIAPIMARFLYGDIEDPIARMRKMSEDMEKIGFDPRMFVRFSRFLRQELGAGAAQQVNTMDAAILRLRSNWQLLMKSLGEGPAGDALTRFFNRMSAVMEQDSFKNFMQDVGRGLARVLDLVGNASEFAARNIDLVKYALLGIAAMGSVNLVIGLGRAFASLLTPITAVGRWLGVIGGGTQVASTAFGRLGAAIGGPVVSAFSRLGALLIPIAAFFVSNPFGIAITAIASLAAGVYLLYQRFDSVREAVDKLWDAIKATFTVLRDALSSVWTWVESNIVTPFSNFLGSSLRSLITGAETLFNGLKETISSAFDTGPLGVFARFVTNIYKAIRSLVDLLPGGASGGTSEAATVSPRDRNRAAGGRGLIGGQGANRGVTVIPGFNTQPGDLPDAAPNAWQRAYQAERNARVAAQDVARGDARRLGQVGAQNRVIDPSLPLPPSAPPEQPLQNDAERRAAGMFDGNNRNRGGRGQQERVENYFARLDSGYRIIEEMEDGMNNLNEARRRGIGTAQDHARWEELIRDRYREQLGVMDSRTKAERQYESAIRALDAAQRQGLVSLEERNRLEEQIRENLMEQRQPVDYMIRQMNEEIELLQRRNGNYEVENQLLQIRNRLRSQGVQLSGEEQERLRTSITAHRNAQQAYNDSQEGMASWANSFRDFGTELAKLEEKFLNQFADALTEFVMTGKANWRDLANSIVSDINNLIIKQGIRELLKWLGLIDGDTAGGFSNKGGASGLLGRAFGGSSNNQGGSQSGGRGIWGEIGGLFGFGGGSAGGGAEIVGTGIAKGAEMYGPSMMEMGASGGGGGGMSGIGGLISSAFNYIVGLFSEGGMSTNPVSAGLVSASSFAGARHFREGGFSSGGIPAYLHDNEAVVPLSRGRKIPVEGGGGGAQINNFNIQTPDADSFRRNRNQVLGGYTKKMARIQQRG